MGCLVGLPFLRCLTKEIFMTSGRNMVCSYYGKFVVEMDNTTTDKRATGSLDRMGTLVVRKRALRVRSLIDVDNIPAFEPRA